MANGVFNRGKKLMAARDTTSIATATLKALLVKSGYSFDATDNFVNDLDSTTNVMDGFQAAYAGSFRVTLTNVTVTEDDSGGFAYVDADDVTFSTVTAGSVVGGAVVYVASASGDTTAEVIAFYDLTNTTTNGGDIVVQWATPANGGVLKLA